jgi:hypothetical protein
LANPAGVHWQEFANPSRDSLLLSILYWMDQREFPAPTLVNSGQHWVVIVGWTTDIKPVLGGSTPLLQSITYNDPDPIAAAGSYTTASGNQWYNGNQSGDHSRWSDPVLYGEPAGTWFGKYVAIIEPPLTKGKVRVMPVKRTGNRLLKPAQAVAAARRWIAEHHLAEIPRYSLLARKDAEVLAPLLVREEPPLRLAGQRAQSRARLRATRVPYYYIIPFGIRGERTETGHPLARVCVLVNGYTGAFEEVTAFGLPVKYLTVQEALNVVAAALKVAPNRLSRADATLMFLSGEITHVRAYPFWRVKVRDRFLYVDQLGRLYGKLLPAIGGD